MSAASSTLDFDEVLERTCVILREMITVDFLGFALPVGREEVLRFHPARIGGPPPSTDLSIPLQNSLCGRVLRTGEFVVIGDAHEMIDDFLAMPDARSALAVPFSAGGEVIGVIAVESYRPNAFDAADLAFYTAIAGRLGAALENARLYMTARARAKEMSRLNEIGRALTSSLDLSTVLRAAMSQIQRLFLAESVLLFQLDAQTGALRVLRAMEGNEPVETDRHLPPGAGVAGWASTHGQPVLVQDAQADPRFSEQEDRCPDGPTRALMAVPLVTSERAIGVIEVGSGEAGIYTRREMNTLQALAATLAVALDNAYLYEQMKALLQERERAQAQLIQAEKMAALGRLAASVAHEINNPLQAAIGCMGLALETLDYQEEAEEYLRVARDEVRRAARTVSQMRDLARPQPVEREPVDVNALLERAVQLIQKQCLDGGIAVRWEPATDLPQVFVVSDQIQQVFLNLVLNAVEAMPDGGELRVTARRVERPTGVQIRFTDTGVGIEADVLPHIFEPFYSTKASGTGLGLATSYSIIESHSGYLSVESVKGNGSTFEVWLPVSDGGE
ncbi:MAG: GAF domain-containing protein [Anaerolineae bacterium]|nr:GAF domain-containing protein [Anaerolineae bacterium]